MALPAYLPVPNVALIADDAQRDAIWRRWLQQFSQRVSSTSVHNNLSGLQGGTTAEYYHLTAAQHALVTSYAHNNLNGLQGGQAGEYYHLTAGQHSTVTSFGTFTNNRVLITGPTSSITTSNDLTYVITTSTLAASNIDVGAGLATAPSIQVGSSQQGLYDIGGNILGVAVAGQVTGQFSNQSGTRTLSISAGTSGSLTGFIASNSATAGNSGSLYDAIVNVASTGDAYYRARYSDNSVSWSWGLDHTDSSWRLSESTVLGTNDRLIFTTSGTAQFGTTSVSSASWLGPLTGTVGATTATTGTFTTISTTAFFTSSSVFFNVSTTNLFVTSTGTLASVDINGGTIDGAAIGSSTASNAVFTNVSTTTLFSSSTATLPLVNIDGGNIDSTAIGAATASTGVFTNVSTTTLFSSSTATLPLVNIDGGNIDSTAIGANTASNAVFTNVSSATVYGTSTVVSPAFNYETQTLNDDQAGYWSFSAAGCFGIISLAGNISNAGSAIVWYRVGNSIFCRSLASSISAGAVVTSTGPLTGTSGTDGNFTISTTSTGTGDRLYIENRTGSVRAYGATFTSIVNGIPTGFTTV